MLNKELLKTDINDSYLASEIKVTEYIHTNGSQNITTRAIASTVSASLSDDGKANSKVLTDVIAAEVLDHIKANAETTGSTDEIIFINSKIRDLITQINNINSALLIFAAAPLTGSAALGTSIGQVTTALADISMALSLRTEIMAKNID